MGTRRNKQNSLKRTQKIKQKYITPQKQKSRNHKLRQGNKKATTRLTTIFIQNKSKKKRHKG